MFDISRVKKYDNVFKKTILELHKKVKMIVPEGHGLLNETIIVNGRESSRFSPGTSFINPIVEKVNEIPSLNPAITLVKYGVNGLNEIVPTVVGVGRNSAGRTATYSNVGAEPNKFNHEPNYDELKDKSNEMDSFMMPKGPVK